MDETTLNGTPTGSYAILENGYRIEVYKDGIRKQVVIRDTKGNIVLVSDPRVNAKDNDLIEAAIKALDTKSSDSTEEIRVVEAEGISPDLATAKKIALFKANLMLSNSSQYVVKNTEVLDEKVYQLEDKSYRYVLKIRGTTIYKNISPNG